MRILDFSKNSEIFLSKVINLVVDSKKAIFQLNQLAKKGKDVRLAGEKWDSDWKTLIAISLSAQSRDETTIKIASALFEKYKSLIALSKAKYSDVLFVLKSLNYNKTKSKNIIVCAKVLVGEFGGKVPLEIEKLISLPGVGRKTANVFLAEMGFDAIGVDTHLAYCAQRLGWTQNKNPHKIESDLCKLFPKSKWKKINPTLVRFGKTYQSKKEKDKILSEIKEK